MISTKAFAGHRVEITVGIIPERNPFLRKAAIVLVVIKGSSGSHSAACWVGVE